MAKETYVYGKRDLLVDERDLYECSESTHACVFVCLCVCVFVYTRISCLQIT